MSSTGASSTQSRLSPRSTEGKSVLGKKVASALIEKRLVACANLVPHVESIYRWEGEIETDKEVKVLLKTKSDLVEKVIAYVEAHASYDVPAILVFPILEGNTNYLDWLSEAVTSSASRDDS